MSDGCCFNSLQMRQPMQLACVTFTIADVTGISTLKVQIVVNGIIVGTYASLNEHLFIAQNKQCH